MPELQATHSYLSHIGIDQLIPMYTENLPQLWKRLGIQTIKTKQEYERIRSEAEFPVLIQIAEGGDLPTTSQALPYQKDFYWRIFALGYEMSETKMMTDQTMVSTVAAITKKLGQSAVRTYNTVVFNVLNNAFAASGANGMDGKALCAYDHPLESGTDSNRGDGAADLDLSATAVKTAHAQLLLQRGHRGSPMPVEKKCKLVVPPQLVPEANEIVKSLYRSDASNLHGVHNPASDVISEVVGSPYLRSDADQWFLISEDNGLHVLELRAPFVIRDMNEKNRTITLGIRCEMDADFHDWRGVWGTAGA